MRAHVLLMICLVAGGAARAQRSDRPKKSVSLTLARGDSGPRMASLADEPAGSIAMVPLMVPIGTPLEIALDREVRVKKIGQPIHGRMMQPVYAFDKLVVPAGTGVIGHISYIEPIPRKKRLLSLLHGNFTPAHTVDVEFDTLQLADGQHLLVDTTVGPGSRRAMHVLTVASRKAQTLKDEAEVKSPARRHRLIRSALAELPIHPQYIDPGALYFAELNEPLGFGSEPLTPTNSEELGETPPAGSLVHALLLTPLDSRMTPKGAPVEAVISQPLFDGNHRLVLPEGSRLKGEVVQVEAARHTHGNGELRVIFYELVPPEGTPQEVAASFEGVQSTIGGPVQLDSEGGCTRFTARGRDVVFPKDTAMEIGFGKMATPSSGHPIQP